MPINRRPPGYQPMGRGYIIVYRPHLVAISPSLPISAPPNRKQSKTSKIYSNNAKVSQSCRTTSSSPCKLWACLTSRTHRTTTARILSVSASQSWLLVHSSITWRSSRLIFIAACRPSRSLTISLVKSPIYLALWTYPTGLPSNFPTDYWSLLLLSRLIGS